VDSLKEEMQKNKELQEHKKILDQRLKELNESEALKEARQKFDKVEKETAESSEVIKHKVKEFRDHIDKMVTEIQKNRSGEEDFVGRPRGIETSEGCCRNAGENC